MAASHNTLDALRKYALTFPGAFEDTPWDSSVVTKVGKKIFVFFGSPESPAISVKLPDSAEMARSVVPGATPTGYGLGRHGWVSIPLDQPGGPEAELLEEWIEESYRAVAPKRLIKELDEAD
jgi:predicted DNA-binding protein (MmcQ/YjbR family)